MGLFPHISKASCKESFEGKTPVSCLQLLPTLFYIPGVCRCIFFFFNLWVLQQRAAMSKSSQVTLAAEPNWTRQQPHEHSQHDCSAFFNFFIKRLETR